jgi:hypothetical protein
MSGGYWVVLSAPSIPRSDRINVQPTSLCNARRVMYSLGARLEARGIAHDVSTEFWVSESGEICEAIRWRQSAQNGGDDYVFVVHIVGISEHEVFEDWGQPWTLG